MSQNLRSLIDELLRGLDDSSPERFHSALAAAWQVGPHSSPGDLTYAIERVTPRFAYIFGNYSKLGVFAGACVEWGGSSLPMREELPERAAGAMKLCKMFPEAWERASGGQPLPENSGNSDLGHVRRILEEDMRRRGQDPKLATTLLLTWFDVDDWLMPLITVLARREFRDAMVGRDRVRAAAAALEPRQLAHWVHGLALVLDDEPLIALDRVTGRGFRLTMSGIGDNFQLSTLLADRLIRPGQPEFIDGTPPEPAWVAAATDAQPGPFNPPHAIRRRLRLSDGHGRYVYIEGRPVDIEPLDGTRVVVVEPPHDKMTWQQGRIYQHMLPTLTLDRILEPAEAAHWFSRVEAAATN